MKLLAWCMAHGKDSVESNSAASGGHEIWAQIPALPLVSCGQVVYSL